VQLLGAAGNQRLGESHGGDGWSKVGLKLGKVRYDWKNFRTKIGEWMCADPSFLHQCNEQISQLVQESQGL